MLNNLPGSLLSTVSTLVEAAKRITALALVDAAVALPPAKGICDSALGALALRTSDGKAFVHYRPSLKPSALLILCHPSDAPSMCRSLADTWERGLRAAGVEVHRVDLDAARQWGLSGPDELQAALKGRGGCVHEDVQRLQDLVEESQFLVFVHPIFWFDVPSQLKGLQESVLSSGFAFRKLPEHWLLNRAAGAVERVPVVRGLMRRYAAYGLLRDKYVFITRTTGGPEAGLGIFGHGSTTLESSLQFCGAHVAAVDVLAELDVAGEVELKERVFPRAERVIEAHCRQIAHWAAAWRLPAKGCLA